MDRIHLGIAAALTAGVLWGFLGLFVRELSSMGFSPIQMTCARYIVVAAVFLAFILLRHRRMLSVSFRTLLLFAVMGVIGNLINSVSYFGSMERIPISLATILQYLMPFIVVAASVPLFGEHITRTKAAALIIAFSGCILCSGVLSDDVPSDVIGILLGIGSAFFYGTYTLCSRAASERGYRTPTVMLYSAIFCVVASLPFSDPAEMVALTFSSARSLLLIVGLGVVVTLVPFGLYNVGINMIGAGRSAIITYVEPMTATIVGYAFYSEAITIGTVLGMILILISLVAINHERISATPIGRTGTRFASRPADDDTDA